MTVLCTNPHISYICIVDQYEINDAGPMGQMIGTKEGLSDHMKRNTRTDPMLHQRNSKASYLAVVCLLALLLSAALYHQRIDSLKTAITDQETVILGLQEQLQRALEDLESLQRDLEERNGSAGDKNTVATYGLVRVSDIDPSIVIDLKYATKDNFTGMRVYPDNAVALLRKDTALKLKNANEASKKDGYRIKVLDAYRPQYIQYVFWYFVPNPNFVSDPLRGSKHNRGASVDVTLVDKDGNEIEMGTAFDDFTEEAAYDYPRHTETALKNMKYLRDVMEGAGFKGISTEWWHFDDADWENYDLINVGFDAFW